MEKLIKVSADELRKSGGGFPQADEVWKNDLYLVGVWRDKNEKGKVVVQLSIKRHDGKPITPDWGHKQEIKNQLVGRDCEGVELYPAESRRVDQANQYHLWVIEDPTFRFPFGWKGGATLDDDDKGELVEE